MRFREIYGIRVPEIIYRFVVEPEKVGEVVLDIGCSSGIVTEFLGELGFATSGIDIFLPDECKNHDNVSYLLTDVRNFKFIKNRYKIVVALDVLQFLINSQKYMVLEKIIDSLSKDGLFIMKSWTINALSFSYHSKNSRLIDKNSFESKNGVMSYFEISDLENFLKKFNVETILFKEDLSIKKDNYGAVELVLRKR